MWSECDYSWITFDLATYWIILVKFGIISDNHGNSRGRMGSIQLGLGSGLGAVTLELGLSISPCLFVVSRRLSQ